MIGVKFTLLLGVAMLSFIVAIALYVVWTRMVGLDPTLAQRCATLSRPARAVLAVVSGSLLGAGIVAAPTVPIGVTALVTLAASVFAGLMLFELVQDRHLSID